MYQSQFLYTDTVTFHELISFVNGRDSKFCVNLMGKTGYTLIQACILIQKHDEIN